MPQIQLAADFFKKEREQNYSNWPLATWRELFQNSIDQDATQIDVGLTAGDGFVNLTFADNGPGMTRQVLNDVYFNIGASTKDTDPTKIGGMGRARILTCFAMQSYRIFSQDYAVIGHGGHYDVVDHAYTDGCKLHIAVDGTDLNTLQQMLDRFLFESRLTARLFVNGERVYNKALNAGRHVRNLEAHGVVFAKVWVNKSAKSQRVIVRVNGVSMFTTSTNANAQIVVELEPSVSRKVLTANRDGLRYDYREALDVFLRELAVDTSSALRSRFGRRTTVARGGGMKTIHRRVSPPGGAPRRTPEPVQANPAALYQAPLAAPPLPYSEDTHTETALSEEFDSWLSRTFGDIYVFDETDNLAMRKAISTYQPDHWKTWYSSPSKSYFDDNGEYVPAVVRPYRKGGHIIRILLLWHTAVSYAIEVAMEALGNTDVPFAVGFVFPSESGTNADCRAQDGGHIFSLCPVNADGKLNYKITERRDLKRLMTWAKHEVTHIGQNWHGEAFSSLREAIDIAFDDVECLRRMKDALRQAKI